jgi:hypothetical protein
MIRGADIAGIIRRGRYRLGCEALFQDDMAAMFTRERLPFTREHILGPADRVDFLVDGRVAVELKIRVSKRSVLRQMERYAAHDCVEELVLASVSPVFMPAKMNEKPVYVVPMGLTGL